jgi:hypothetical protein
VDRNRERSRVVGSRLYCRAYSIDTTEYEHVTGSNAVSTLCAVDILPRSLASWWRSLEGAARGCWLRSLRRLGLGLVARTRLPCRAAPRHDSQLATSTLAASCAPKSNQINHDSHSGLQGVKRRLQSVPL